MLLLKRHSAWQASSRHGQRWGNSQRFKKTQRLTNRHSSAPHQALLQESQ
jgi:hypothetical protein